MGRWAVFPLPYLPAGLCLGRPRVALTDALLLTVGPSSHSCSLPTIMASPTLSRKAAKAVWTLAKAASGKWAMLVPGMLEGKVTGPTPTPQKSSAGKWPPSASESLSEDEDMVRSIKKKHVAPEVEEEVIMEPDTVSSEGYTEDVIELERDDNTEEEEVSAYSYTLTTV